jgi:glycosyltransferase involved in cell wall biosynthesis
MPARSKLASGAPINVVFLNDVGFQYGAGIALKRQAASLLLKGWNVSVVASAPGEVLDPPTVTGISRFENWRGIHRAWDVHAEEGLSPEHIITELTAKVLSLDPDVVISGNLHGADWPLRLLPRLRSVGIPVVAFMHDMYLVTGRCAYPLSCTLYRSGCDASCPTSHEYPRLAPEKIAPAWRERGDIFTGPERIPLVGNSKWTRKLAVQRFGATATTDVVHLGIDHELFTPMPKTVARRLLGIPDNKPIILMGAVDVHDQWKGGPSFHELLGALVQRVDLDVVVFGRLSEKLTCRKSFGLVRDERMMPLILNAADIFVSAATAESFGQSLLEASACGLPVIAFNVGGVSDVVVDNETGLLVDHQTVPNLLIAIDRLLKNATEREEMGRKGRLRVEKNFTLTHQADAWVECLNRIC